jgi:hypothetical protein
MRSMAPLQASKPDEKAGQTRWLLACDNLSAMMRLLACSLCVYLATVALAEDDILRELR